MVYFSWLKVMRCGRVSAKEEKFQDMSGWGITRFILIPPVSGRRRPTRVVKKEALDMNAPGWTERIGLVFVTAAEDTLHTIVGCWTRGHDYRRMDA